MSGRGRPAIGKDVVLPVPVGPASLARGRSCFAEQLTGWVIAECEDLDGAVRLATAIPAAWYGSVEVRPAGETLT